MVGVANTNTAVQQQEENVGMRQTQTHDYLVCNRERGDMICDRNMNIHAFDETEKTMGIWQANNQRRRTFTLYRYSLHTPYIQQQR